MYSLVSLDKWFYNSMSYTLTYVNLNCTISIYNIYTKWKTQSVKKLIGSFFPWACFIWYTALHLLFVPSFLLYHELATRNYVYLISRYFTCPYIIISNNGFVKTANCSTTMSNGGNKRAELILWVIFWWVKYHKCFLFISVDYSYYKVWLTNV